MFGYADLVVQYVCRACSKMFRHVQKPNCQGKANCSRLQSLHGLLLCGSCWATLTHGIIATSNTIFKQRLLRLLLLYIVCCHIDLGQGRHWVRQSRKPQLGNNPHVVKVTEPSIYRGRKQRQRTLAKTKARVSCSVVYPQCWVIRFVKISHDFTISQQSWWMDGAGSCRRRYPCSEILFRL
jgi:hypothetical protein